MIRIVGPKNDQIDLTRFAPGADDVSSADYGPPVSPAIEQLLPCRLSLVTGALWIVAASGFSRFVVVAFHAVCYRLHQTMESVRLGGAFWRWSGHGELLTILEVG